MTEEMYENNFDGVLNEQQWVKYDESLCVENTVEIVAQVNGKIKAKLVVPVDGDKEEILANALKDDKVNETIDGKKYYKTDICLNKLV